MKTKEKSVNFTFESVLDGAFFKIGNIEIKEGNSDIELVEEDMDETEDTISNPILTRREKSKLSYVEQMRAIGLEPREYGKHEYVEKGEQQALAVVLEETVYEIDNIEKEEEKKIVNELCESNDIELKLDANDEIENAMIESETKDIEETIADDNIMLTLNVDKVSYDKKPDDDEEVRAIQRRIGSCKTTVGVDELISAIENGRSFKALMGARI
ncbi:hypothetical protein [Clostridium butyricum]|uniref:hypothetical protein n=1 Tax=Clostridium butyricum TaxID=1492 RepID=UPI00374F5BC5